MRRPLRPNRDTKGPHTELTGAVFCMSARVQRILAIIVSLVIGLALFAGLIFKEGWTVIQGQMLSFGILPFLGFVCLSFFNFGLYALRWLLIARRIPGSGKVAFGRLFFHRMSGYAAGYLTPGTQVAGEPVRVGLMMIDDASSEAATSSVVLDLAFEIASYAVFITLGVLFAGAQGLGGDGALVVPTIIMSVVLAFIFAFFVQIARGGGFFSHALWLSRLDRFPTFKALHVWFVNVEKMMSDFFGGRFLFSSGLFLLSLVMTAFRMFEVVYICHFFGVDLELWQAFLLSTLPGVSLFLPVPGGVGVLEGSYTAVATLVGAPISGVAFALMLRARDALFIAIGVVHAILQGQSLWTKKSPK